MRPNWSVFHLTADNIFTCFTYKVDKNAILKFELPIQMTSKFEKRKKTKIKAFEKEYHDEIHISTTLNEC